MLKKVVKANLNQSNLIKEDEKEESIKKAATLLENFIAESNNQGDKENDK